MPNRGIERGSTTSVTTLSSFPLALRNISERLRCGMRAEDIYLWTESAREIQNLWVQLNVPKCVSAEILHRMCRSQGLDRHLLLYRQY